MCLFKASFAKAESNVLLSSLFIGKDHVEELAQEKLKAAKKVIVKEQGRGIFPIMGYSYYEYGNSLKENGDVLSSLIFSEYALELSDIEIYFPRKGFGLASINLPQLDSSFIVLSVSAFVLGLAVGMFIIIRLVYKKQKHQTKSKQKKSIRRR
jgi:hypothetical protein